MTVTERDIWATANVLIKQHGEDVGIYAAKRADELLAKGDIEGEIVFKRIVAAIAELQRRHRDAGEVLN